MTAQVNIGCRYRYLTVAIAGAMFVLNPGYIGTLFQNPLGLMMVGVAVVMMLFGAFLLTQIVKVKG